MEKKMETIGIIGILWCLAFRVGVQGFSGLGYRDNGKENGNYDLGLRV